MNTPNLTSEPLRLILWTVILVASIAVAVLVSLDVLDLEVLITVLAVSGLTAVGGEVARSKVTPE